MDFHTDQATNVNTKLPRSAPFTCIANGIFKWGGMNVNISNELNYSDVHVGMERSGC